MAKPTSIEDLRKIKELLDKNPDLKSDELKEEFRKIMNQKEEDKDVPTRQLIKREDVAAAVRGFQRQRRIINAVKGGNKGPKSG